MFSWDSCVCVCLRNKQEESVKKIESSQNDFESDANFKTKICALRCFCNGNSNVRR